MSAFEVAKTIPGANPNSVRRALQNLTYSRQVVKIENPAASMKASEPRWLYAMACCVDDDAIDLWPPRPTQAALDRMVGDAINERTPLEMVWRRFVGAA